MTKKVQKKKILAAAILTSGIAFAISKAAIAGPNSGPPYPVPCRMEQINPVIQKAKEKFLQETVEIRKETAQKRAAMRAVMAADNPDTDKASQIAGELFELREQLRAKALEYGLSADAYGTGAFFHGGRHHKRMF